MTETLLRPIAPAEAERAYAIICETVEWLLSRGIRQWKTPLPREVFDLRQARGENLGLIADGSLAVVLGLVRHSPAHWADETGGRTPWWLCTLATANVFRGRGLGRSAVRAAIERARQAGAGELLLDCVWGSGFLPEFYGSLGFDMICRKEIDWPKCGPVEMALMRRDLASSVDSRPARRFTRAGGPLRRGL